MTTNIKHVPSYKNVSSYNTSPVITMSPVITPSPVVILSPSSVVSQVRPTYILICACFSDAYFTMFDSGVDQDDLLFSDSTVRLVEVDSDKQTYEKYLGESFLKAVNTLNQFDCTNGQTSITINTLLLLIAFLYCVFL